MIRRVLVGLCGVLCAVGLAAAQDDSLTVTEIAIVPGLDFYGQQVLFAEGTLLNQGDRAFADVSLMAQVFDPDGVQVGEGLGYLVNACRAGLLPGFALQPGAAQPFAIALELYESDATAARVEVAANGTPGDPAPVIEEAPLPGITRVASREIVSVEWLEDAAGLRFAAGCWRDLFNRWSWFDYDPVTGTEQPGVHPRQEAITPALLRQLGLQDPLILAHSFLQFAPNARRLVYQTELNKVVTAEPDGSFKRELFDGLANRTLQGITWLDEGRFLAYYYGAYGDPVLYFTASVDGQQLSEPPANSLPSIITPGASPDGERIVLAAEVNGVTGYYLKRAAFPTTDLLFEAQAPGNNWPGPLFERDADGQAFIYAALPVDGAARLQCFNLQTRELHDLSPLPLQLASDERGWWWLSPDNNTIALAANGLNGGLWLIDLNALDSCA